MTAKRVYGWLPPWRVCQGPPILPLLGWPQLIYLWQTWQVYQIYSATSLGCAAFYNAILWGGTRMKKYFFFACIVVTAVVAIRLCIGLFGAGDDNLTDIRQVGADPEAYAGQTLTGRSIPTTVWPGLARTRLAGRSPHSGAGFGGWADPHPKPSSQSRGGPGSNHQTGKL